MTNDNLALLAAKNKKTLLSSSVLSFLSLGVSSNLLPDTIPIVFSLCAIATSSYIYGILNTHKIDFEKLNTDEFKKMLSIYRTILILIGKLYKELNINNPYDIANAFRNMLYDNRFCINRRHFNNNPTNVKDLIRLYPLDIINGQGCCRHIASFLTDIYNILNIEACNLSVKLDSLLTNHVINLVIYDDLYYLIDAYNKSVFIAKSNHKLINDYGDKISINYLTDKIDKRVCFINGTPSLNPKQIITNMPDDELAFRNFILSRTKIVRILKSNQSLLNDFQAEVNPLYEEIINIYTTCESQTMSYKRMLFG